jgi:hypothetical protein
LGLRATGVLVLGLVVSVVLWLLLEAGVAFAPGSG